MSADPYKTLGLSRGADIDAVKTAYRSLAKQHHPDLKPGDKANERRFQDISAAYSFLSDKDKKAKFDRGDIDADGNPMGFGGGGQWQDFSSKRQYRGRSRPYTQDGTTFDAGDIFEDLFGFSGRKRGRTAGSGFGGAGFGAGGERADMKGRDINYTLAVSFTEAALGAKKTVNMGQGKTLAITIPPGAVDGQTLRLKGQGHPGSVNAGDALVKLNVQTHPLYTRDGNDVTVEVPISLPEAVLGDIITVPTLHGQVSLKVPAGANTGLVLRLRGKGIQGSIGLPGDQYVRLKIMLPDSIDSELEAFMRKWGKKNDYDVRKGLA